MFANSIVETSPGWARAKEKTKQARKGVRSEHPVSPLDFDEIILPSCPKKHSLQLKENLFSSILLFLEWQQKACRGGRRTPAAAVGKNPFDFPKERSPQKLLFPLNRQSCYSDHPEDRPCLPPPGGAAAAAEEEDVLQLLNEPFPFKEKKNPL